MDNLHNKEIIMSNKKYIICDKILYIDRRFDKLIDDIREIRIQTQIVKEYLTEDLIN